MSFDKVSGRLRYSFRSFPGGARGSGFGILIWTVCPNIRVWSWVRLHSWAEAILQAGSCYFLKGISVVHHSRYLQMMHLFFIPGSTHIRVLMLLIKIVSLKRKNLLCLFWKSLVFKNSFVININIYILLTLLP